MSNKREFLPGDEVEVLLPPDISDGAKVGTIISIEHNGYIDVEFPNGEKANISTGDLRRLNK